MCIRDRLCTAQWVAKTVLIHVSIVSRLHSFIRRSVTIIVNAVTNFCGSRVDGIVVVVAVTTGGYQFYVGFISHWSKTLSKRGSSRLSVTIIVCIVVPYLSGFFQRIVVITICIIGDITARLSTSLCTCLLYTSRCV